MKKLLVIFVLAGCTPFAPKRERMSQEPKPQEPLTPDQVRQAKRIVVEYGGGFTRGTTERFVFEASGKCICETSSWYYPSAHESAVFGKDKKIYELPPETFREVQKILVESKYLSLGGLPGFNFEGGSRISVECAERHHFLDIHSYGDGDYPRDFQRMMSFLGSLRDSRKEIPSTTAPPEK